ncbi:MAG: glycosyltransferase [Armatimonadetes bacterium]|nr:glycosyltransferase [Armatimonadota bacterium]
MQGNRPRPLVSVVMPVYNAEHYLREAMDSVLGQTFGDLELIVVDDGSADSSPKIIEQYQNRDSRVRPIHQENQGVASAINTGLRTATGKYIARLDSDDVAVKDRLAKQVDYMESHPETGVCGTRCSFFGDRGNFVGAAPPTDHKTIQSRLLFLPTLSHTSVIMRRDLIVEHNLFYSTDVGLAEDYDLWVRFSRHSKIANLPDVLTNIRTHASSTTRRVVNQDYACVTLVHKQILTDLGIDATPEELDLHLGISICRIEKSKDYVDRVEDWLCKLLDANDRTAYCDRKALARVLFERWCTVCAAQYELGTWTLRRLIRSRLYLGHYPFTRYGLAFAARCILKRQSLRRWRARSQRAEAA